MKTVSRPLPRKPPLRVQGIGVGRNPTRARELYDEAYEAGSAAAAYFLGHRFHVGDEELGIEEDGARALQLLRHAVELVCVHEGLVCIPPAEGEAPLLLSPTRWQPFCFSV